MEGSDIYHTSPVEVGPGFWSGLGVKEVQDSLGSARTWDVGKVWSPVSSRLVDRYRHQESQYMSIADVRVCSHHMHM